MPLAIDQVTSLKAIFAKDGTKGLLDSLDKQLREQEKYHELFEVLKMKTRHGLGLPVIHFPDEEAFDQPIRDRLDDALIEVCREVGTLFMKKGQIQEGWMYLRPVGDTKRVAQMLREIEVTDENLDSMIGISLSEGVDPCRGFDLVLERYGTCNAITTFESEMPRRSIVEQRYAAAQLVRHLYSELKPNLIHDIVKRSAAKGDQPAITDSDLQDKTIAELLAGRDELFEDHAYHIDTTHLASVVRFAKLLTAPDDLRLARELVEYGQRLSSQYHYDGDEPFTDVYGDHAKFLDVVLGTDVDAGLAFFKEKAESVDAYTQGTMAAEVYVDLLCRTGRFKEALDASIERLQGKPSMGVAPSLLEICRQAKDYEPLFEYCQAKDDLLGFGTGLLISNDKE